MAMGIPFPFIYFFSTFKAINQIFAFMKKIMACLLWVPLLLMYSCDNNDDPVVAYYTQNNLDKAVVQTVATNLGTGFNDLFADRYTDSLSRARFCIDFTQGARFMDDGSGYVFVETLNGYNIAHPANPSLEGTSTIGQTDADGKKIVEEMISMVQHTGFGFLEYNYENPATQTIQKKTTFVKAIPEASWYAGAGFYHHSGPLYTANELNEEVVKQSVEAMAGGVGAVLQAHAADSLQGVDLMRALLKNIRFFDDQSGYFYVIDFNGYNVVQPPDPSIQGTYEWDIQDSRGNYLVRGLVETAQNGGGFYTYYWEDYTSGQEKLKTAYVQKIPGQEYLIGSGVYNSN